MQILNPRSKFKKSDLFLGGFLQGIDERESIQFASIEAEPDLTGSSYHNSADTPWTVALLDDS